MIRENKTSFSKSLQSKLCTDHLLITCKVIHSHHWASLVAQMVKNLPAMQETQVGKIPWRTEWLPTPVFLPGEFQAQRNLVGYIVPGVARVRHSQYPDGQIPHISRFQCLPLHFLPFTFVSEHIPLVCKPNSALEPLSSNCSWNSVLFFTFYFLFLLLSFSSHVSYSLEKLSVGKKYYKFLHCKVTSFVKSI